MPYIIPVSNNDLFEIRMVGSLHSQTTISIFRYRLERASGTGSLDMEPLLDDFIQGVWGALRTILSVELTSVRFYLQKIFPVRYVAFEKVPEDTMGEVTGNCCPSYVAFVFRKKLLIAGRSYQGRWFFPGVPVSSEVDSKVSPTVLASAEVTNLKIALLDTLEQGPGVEGVPSLIVPDGGGYANRGALNTIEVDPVLRAQRRREVGRGI